MTAQPFAPMPRPTGHVWADIAARVLASVAVMVGAGVLVRRVIW